MSNFTKSAVISGPTGTIGMSLIEKLLSENFRLLLLIHKNSIKKNNLVNNRNIKVIEIDLEEYSNFNLKEKYEIFFHFAWSGTTGDSRNDYKLQISNILYSVESVNLAERLGCTKFIGAGSQAEYGEHSKKTKPYDFLKPLNYYGAGKLSTYYFTKIRCNELGLKHIWFRVFSVYGPYDSPKTLVLSAISSFLKNETIDFSSAIHNWDYLYASDAANAFYLASVSNLDDKIYCLGSGISYPLKHYINIIKEQTNIKYDLLFGKKENKDVHIKYLEADIKDLKSDLNFAPTVKFQEGIRKTIEWYNNNNNNNK